MTAQRIWRIVSTCPFNTFANNIMTGKSNTGESEKKEKQKRKRRGKKKEEEEGFIRNTSLQL
tara:strand:- start:201 stop:386 length:186 start_codon:yes stop_codon:yes gene_type:complete